MAKTEPMTSDPEFLKKLKKAQEAQKDTKKLADEMRRKAKAQAADSKVRPAKDIKSGDMRSKALKEAKAADAKKVQGAKDLKPGDMRSNFLDDAKQRGPRAAKDVKPGDLRSNALEKARSAANKAASETPKQAAEEAVETAAKKRGFGSALGRAAGRVGGPVAALVGMTEEANKGEKEWLAERDARRAREKAAIRKPSPQGSYIAANERIPRRGKTFERGKGEAVLPANVPTTERGVLGGAGVQGYGYGRKGNYQLGKNVKERATFAGGEAKPPKPRMKPASDKSRLSGKKADKVVQGSEKKVSDFALATRRGQSDEYIKAKMRPKRSIMELFKSEKKAAPKKVGKPLTSTFAKKNLAANQKLGKS